MLEPLTGSTLVYRVSARASQVAVPGPDSTLTCFGISVRVQCLIKSLVLKGNPGAFFQFQWCPLEDYLGIWAP